MEIADTMNLPSREPGRPGAMCINLAVGVSDFGSVGFGREVSDDSEAEDCRREGWI